MPCRDPFKGYRFPKDVILLAVRWYCRYPLSYRNVRDLLAERGITIDAATIYRWVQKFAPEIRRRAYGRHRSWRGLQWYVDETYVRVNGRWCYLWRAVDQCGQLIDFRLTARPLIFGVDKIGRAGAFVTLDRLGELAVSPGFMRPEDELREDADVHSGGQAADGQGAELSAAGNVDAISQGRVITSDGQALGVNDTKDQEVCSDSIVMNF